MPVVSMTLDLLHADGAFVIVRDRFEYGKPHGFEALLVSRMGRPLGNNRITGDSGGEVYRAARSRWPVLDISDERLPAAALDTERACHASADGHAH